MQTALITLKNDFHNTECTINVIYQITTYADNRPDEIEIRPTAYQVNKCRKALCGIKDCKCGDTMGTRGPQRDSSGNVIVVEYPFG